MGIVTCRMLIHLRKFNDLVLFDSAPARKSGQPLRFASLESGKSMQDTHPSSTTADLESAFNSQSTKNVWLDSDSERTVGIQNFTLQLPFDRIIG